MKAYAYIGTFLDGRLEWKFAPVPSDNLSAIEGIRGLISDEHIAEIMADETDSVLFNQFLTGEANSYVLIRNNEFLGGLRKVPIEYGDVYEIAIFDTNRIEHFELGTWENADNLVSQFLEKYGDNMLSWCGVSADNRVTQTFYDWNRKGMFSVSVIENGQVFASIQIKLRHVHKAKTKGKGVEVDTDKKILR